METTLKWRKGDRVMVGGDMVLIIASEPATGTYLVEHETGAEMRIPNIHNDEPDYLWPVV